VAKAPGWYEQGFALIARVQSVHLGFGYCFISIGMFLLRLPLILAILAIQFVFVSWFLWAAYEIRLYPVKIYGYIIHEFDPWFNYRAAEYLAEHGSSKFFKWYDHESWYPLGRPVGTTIYPGMQLTAVGIWEAMKMAPVFTYKLEYPGAVKSFLKIFRAGLKRRGYLWFPPTPKKLSFAPMSVNDICVMIPAWFGSLASLFGGLLAYEASRSINAGICAVGVMAIIPANLMRSVAGAFDNEAVAVAAILSTFWLWTLSVRNPSTWPFGALAALSYVFMVASWGGYIFVINAIGLHALILVGLGRFNSGVHKAYSLFYLLGTYGATRIPVVGFTPLRSLEQIGPLGIFLGYQVLAYCDFQRRRHKMDVREFVLFRIRTFALLVAALLAAAVILAPMGYFGPLSSRIRGLFVKHTKTGNPLVDSVAEHQPANSGMYRSHLNLPLDYVLPGTLVCFFKRNNATYFLGVYGWIAWHFSLKMSRLVLICGPIVAIICGIWLGFALDFIVEPFLLVLGKKYPPVNAIFAGSGDETDGSAEKKEDSKNGKGKAKEQPSKAKKAVKKDSKARVRSEQELGLEEWDEEYRPGGMAQIKRKAKIIMFNSPTDDVWDGMCNAYNTWKRNSSFLGARILLSLVLVFYLVFVSNISMTVARFFSYCDQTAHGMSSPTILKMARGPRGEDVILDDALQGYKWMDKETPKDSRVAAWWDYGYQITGIGRRTSLADGNTWNHEHIATLGRLLSGTQKSSHSVLRHLADYVLIMTGAVNDDLAISTHFARIGNSVFPDHCGDEDPYCQKYTLHGGDQHQPSPMMKKSLVYNLYMHGKSTSSGADPKLFQMVWKSSNDQMRLFKVLNVSQESKDWVANPENKLCDAPGSWYCVGQYPPAIKKFLNKRRSFAQVEDFNKKGQKSAYTKMIEKEKRGDL
jgi:dolichyl-diphosphooligosaccharide--protein glycosyltransferase